MPLPRRSCSRFRIWPGVFVALEVAKAPGKRELLFVRQRLIAEDEHGMSRHAVMNGVNVTRIERLRAIDRRSFTCEGFWQRTDDDRHLRLLLAPNPLNGV